MKRFTAAVKNYTMLLLYDRYETVHFADSLFFKIMDSTNTATRLNYQYRKQPSRCFLNAGVPQGTAISPLLYILFTKDTPLPPQSLAYPSAGLAQCADDTAYWALEFTGKPYPNYS